MFSETNGCRTSQIYMSTCAKPARHLANSRLKDLGIRRLYIMDMMSISFFKDILQGVDQNQKKEKRKGEIKAYTIIKACECILVVEVLKAVFGKSKIGQYHKISLRIGGKERTNSQENDNPEF